LGPDGPPPSWGPGCSHPDIVTAATIATRLARIRIDCSSFQPASYPLAVRSSCNSAADCGFPRFNECPSGLSITLNGLNFVEVQA
jgi:hypothetical protein